MLPFHCDQTKILIKSQRDNNKGEGLTMFLKLKSRMKT